MSNGTQVRQTRQGRWRGSLDGSTEARISYGTSPRGHHYAIEVSSLGGDPGMPAWSRPFRNAEHAERVANARSAAALDGREELQIRSAGEMTAAAKVARALSNAAAFRKTAATAKTPEARERLFGIVREQLGRARAERDITPPPASVSAAVTVSTPKPIPASAVTPAMRDAARRATSVIPTSALDAARHQQLDQSTRLSLR